MLPLLPSTNSTNSSMTCGLLSTHASISNSDLFQPHPPPRSAVNSPQQSTLLTQSNGNGNGAFIYKVIHARPALAYRQPMRSMATTCGHKQVDPPKTVPRLPIQALEMALWCVGNHPTPPLPKLLGTSCGQLTAQIKMPLRMQVVGLGWSWHVPVLLHRAARGWDV